MMLLILDGLVILSAVLALACVVAYQGTTRGAWRTTEHGRHLMAFMASMTGVLGLWATRVIAVDVLGLPDPGWFQAARAAVFASIPLVLAWRLWLIVTADPSSDLPSHWRFR